MAGKGQQTANFQGNSQNIKIDNFEPFSANRGCQMTSDGNSFMTSNLTNRAMQDQILMGESPLPIEIIYVSDFPEEHASERTASCEKLYNSRYTC